MTFEELYEKVFNTPVPADFLFEAKDEGFYFEALYPTPSVREELASELKGKDFKSFREDISPVLKDFHNKAQRTIPRNKRFTKLWLGLVIRISVKVFTRKAGKLWGSRLDLLLKTLKDSILQGLERGAGDEQHFIDVFAEEFFTYYALQAIYPVPVHNEWERIAALLRYKDASWLEVLDVYKFILLLMISETDDLSPNYKMTDAIEELVGDSSHGDEEDEEVLLELQELDEVLQEKLQEREERNQLERRVNRNREIALAIRKLQTMSDKDFSFRYKYQWIGVYEVMCDQHLLPDGEKSTFCRLCNSPDNREYFLPEDEDQLPNPYIPGESGDKESTWHQLSSHGDTPKQQRVIEKTKKEFLNLLREQEVI